MKKYEKQDCIKRLNSSRFLKVTINLFFVAIIMSSCVDSCPKVIDPMIIDPMISIAQDYAFSEVVNSKLWYYVSYDYDSLPTLVKGQLGNIIIRKDSSNYLNGWENYFYSIDFGMAYVSLGNTADTLKGTVDLCYTEVIMIAGIHTYTYNCKYKNFYLNKNKINGILNHLSGSSNASGSYSYALYSDTLTRSSDGGNIIVNKTESNLSDISSRGISFSVTELEALSILSDYTYITKGRVQIETDSKKFIIDFGNGAKDNKATLIYEGINTPFTLNAFR